MPVAVMASPVASDGAGSPAVGLSPRVENFLIGILRQLSKYEQNVEQRQGGSAATCAFACVDCEVIFNEMHALFDCMPLKKDAKVRGSLMLQLCCPHLISLCSPSVRVLTFTLFS